ncbi:MAG TPA: DMT family transporter [Anaerolineales bacterium]|nr:DMT family transporter [Anaerolineales bacterium]
MAYIGEISALVTGVFWSLSAIGFTMAGKDYSSNIINRIRITLAFLALLLINYFSLGLALPIHAEAERWGFFLLSGILGYALGDHFLFSSYQIVGPRIGLLLLSLHPVFSTIIAWFLGETLTWIQISGVVITVVGIGWVVLLKSGSQLEDERFKITKKGVIYGLLAAVGQSTGLIFSKMGMTEGFPAIAGNVIRMLAAFLFLWIAAVFGKEVGITFRAVFQKPKSFLWVFFGAMMGPVIGVSLSLYAVQKTREVAVASTLMGLSPIFMLPISYYFFHERFGWKVVIGTVLALVGVTILLIFRQ